MSVGQVAARAPGSSPAQSQGVGGDAGRDGVGWSGFEGGGPRPFRSSPSASLNRPPNLDRAGLASAPQPQPRTEAPGGTAGGGGAGWSSAVTSALEGQSAASCTIIFEKPSHRMPPPFIFSSRNGTLTQGGRRWLGDSGSPSEGWPSQAGRPLPFPQTRESAILLPPRPETSTGPDPPPAPTPREGEGCDFAETAGSSSLEQKPSCRAVTHTDTPSTEPQKHLPLEHADQSRASSRPVRCEPRRLRNSTRQGFAKYLTTR